MHPDELGTIQMKGMNLMVTLIQKDLGMRRSKNGKREGGETELKVEKLQWTDGFILQKIFKLLTIGMDRKIGTLKKRTARLLMVGDHGVGGGSLVMGITRGHEGDMDGVGIEMDVIEEESYHDQRPRKPKIDFPRFDGGDPHEWLDKAQHYFHVYEVPRDES